MSGEKIVYKLTSMEIFGAKGESDTVVLAMYSGLKETYFELTLHDLLTLIQRMLDSGISSQRKSMS